MRKLVTGADGARGDADGAAAGRGQDRRKLVCGEMRTVNIRADERGAMCRRSRRWSGRAFPTRGRSRSIARELENELSLWLVAAKGETVLGYVGSQTVLGRGGYDESWPSARSTGGRGSRRRWSVRCVAALRAENGAQLADARGARFQRGGHPRSMTRSALPRSGGGQTITSIRRRMRASSERTVTA